MSVLSFFGPSNEKDALGSTKKPLSDLQQVNLFTIPFLLVSVVTVVWYFGFTANAGAALIWALASLTAGGAIGFLFGIPRSSTPKPRQAADSPAPKSGSPTSVTVRNSGLRPNTNLEDVSDWLTKIIVGLGLVHLSEIGPGISKISAITAAGWSSIPAAQGQSLATAIVVAFAVTGFLMSYVYTRLFLQAAIGRADNVLDLIGQTEQALAALPKVSTDPETPAVLSAPELKVAEGIRLAAGIDDMPGLLDRMRSLGREYEQIRQTSESGSVRTQQMADIVQKMRGYALATMPELAEFAHSTSPGQRLAAVAMLQAQFNPVYTQWLADRLVEEKPFIGFNAASVLLTASKSQSGETVRKIKDCVQVAKSRLVEAGLKDTDRDRLIDRILEANTN